VAGYCSEWQFATAGRTSFTMPEWEPDTKGPKNRFSAVVIVEKEGIAELLIRVGVGRKFDVAIIGNEGQSVEAELKLADRMDLPTFVLHDFDRSGLTICQNLRDGTWRHRYKNDFDVVEIGLRLDQVRGLESEPITKKNRQSVGDRRLRECGATEDEVKFLYSKRVELNALITEDLVRMVEDALTAHGIEKVVPDAENLTAAWRSAKAHAEIETAMEAANEAAEHWLEEAAPADLDERIREHLMRHPLGSWDSALRDIVSRGA
jgi:predicted ATP-dependent endonuclease of OLD family